MMEDEDEDGRQEEYIEKRVQFQGREERKQEKGEKERRRRRTCSRLAVQRNRRRSMPPER